MSADVAVRQLVEDLAHRADVARRTSISSRLSAKSRSSGPVGRRRDDLVLDVVDRVAEPVGEREVAVDDVVGERPQQVVRAVAEDRARRPTRRWCVGRGSQSGVVDGEQEAVGRGRCRARTATTSPRSAARTGRCGRCRRSSRSWPAGCPRATSSTISGWRPSVAAIAVTWSRRRRRRRSTHTGPHRARRASAGSAATAASALDSCRSPAADAADPDRLPARRRRQRAGASERASARVGWPSGSASVLRRSPGAASSGAASARQHTRPRAAEREGRRDRDDGHDAGDHEQPDHDRAPPRATPSARAPRRRAGRAAAGRAAPPG